MRNEQDPRLTASDLCCATDDQLLSELTDHRAMPLPPPLA